MQVVLPHLAYPPLVVRLLAEGLVLGQGVVELGAVVRVRGHASDGSRGAGAVCEAHSGALATEARVWEAGSRAVEPGSPKGVGVGGREGAHLGVGAEVLVAHGPSLGLGMRGKARLGEGRPGAEPP